MGGGQVLRGGGEDAGALVRAAVPLWRVLRVCQAEGTGEQEHSLDCGVYRTEKQEQGGQLYSHLLSAVSVCFDDLDYGRLFCVQTVVARFITTVSSQWAVTGGY